VDFLAQVNAFGHVLGGTFRYGDAGADSGRDQWVYDGSSTRLIGLTGPGYEYQSATQKYRYSVAGAITPGGHVVGQTRRRNTSNTDLGADTWLFDGSDTMRIGPSGAGYEYQLSPLSPDVYRYSNFTGLNNAGQALGYTRRFSPSGENLGQDAWQRSGSTISVLGLSGATYEFATPTGGTFRSSSPTAQNQGGRSIGDSNRYSTTRSWLGADSWSSVADTPQLINLTGPQYEYDARDQSGKIIGRFRESRALTLNDAGQVVGSSNRYSFAGGDAGRDAWLFDGQTTRLISLTGPNYEWTTGDGSIARISEPRALTASGYVLGYSSRLSGTDGWIYHNGTTRRVGLSGGIYEATGHRWGQADAINEAGQSIGRTQIFPASGYYGQDAWFDDGSTARRIGLSGGVYEYRDANQGNAIVRASWPTQLNASGKVIGWSRRYSLAGDILGAAGWFYDPLTDETTELAFGVRPTDQFCETFPAYVTDTGVVLGTYKQYDAGTQFFRRAFWWSVEDGFHDLGQLVGGGLASAGWQYLTSPDYPNNTVDRAVVGVMPGGSPQYILGYGILIGQAEGSASGFLLTAIPEPATGITGVVIPLLLIHWRRIARR
jgi:hypothetical protein